MCDEEHTDLSETRSGTEYKLGCSDDVEFGVQFARNFLLKGHSITESTSREREIIIHNLIIGTEVGAINLK